MGGYKYHGMSLEECLGNVGLAPDACMGLLVFDNTKLDSLLQAMLVKMAAVTTSNTQQQSQIQTLTAQLDQLSKDTKDTKDKPATLPSEPDIAQTVSFVELERRCTALEATTAASDKQIAVQQAQIAAAVEVQSKMEQRISDLTAANQASAALISEAKAAAEAASQIASKALQTAATSQAEAIAARTLADGLDKSVKKTQSSMAEVASLAQSASEDVKELSERTRQLEMANERLKGELGAIEALREAIGTLDGHSGNSADVASSQQFAELRQSMTEWTEKVEKQTQAALASMSKEIMRLEMDCLKSVSAAGGEVPASVNRELERVHRALAAKADASFLEPLQRDVSSARQWQRANEGLLKQLDRATAENREKLVPVAKAVSQIGNKADIDYVDEVNDIASMREMREITSLKNKFNELLNFLASAAPNLLGEEDGYPRGTKMQLLRCISCDRGGSPPREDVRGADGRIYQGMDGKQKMAQQGVTSPKKIELRSMGGFRARPSSAPAKRKEGPQIKVSASAAGIRSPIPEGGSRGEVDVSGRGSISSRKQKGLENVQPRYG